ncbi:MAG: FAD-binding oxidoreductase [Hespellia sp.]|nr:FAD-binding oxidoreductase [Hespellia sp.]
MNRQELLAVIADENRVITENIDEKYQSDVLGRIKGNAGAVVLPVSTEEVSRILNYANEKGIKVTPRGAGTNLVGSTVPTEGGIVLDLSRMNRVLEIDTDTLSAVVEPGVILEDFQKQVEELGLFYPPDPGEKIATIGGNISTNAGGMRAVKYGVTRDYVLGLEVVLADGEVVNLGSKNIKDSSGLSLKNLIIGSEGTLAVITKCILKLVPKPETTISAVAAFPSLKDGIENVLRIIQQNANPTALEFVERKVLQLGEDYLGIRFPYENAEAYIILTFDGNENEVRENAEKVGRLVKEQGALDYLILEDEKTRNDVWKLRGVLVKAVEAISEQEPVDIVVPIDKTAEYIQYVNQLEKELSVQIVSFGHAGDGNVHLCVVKGNRTEEQWKREKHKVMSLIYKKAYELGGLTSGEHGIGLSKKEYFLAETKDENLNVMRRVKRAFDEHCILNNHIAYNI